MKPFVNRIIMLGKLPSCYQPGYLSGRVPRVSERARRHTFGSRKRRFLKNGSMNGRDVRDTAI